MEKTVKIVRILQFIAGGSAVLSFLSAVVFTANYSPVVVSGIVLVLLFILEEYIPVIVNRIKEDRLRERGREEYLRIIEEKQEIEILSKRIDEIEKMVKEMAEIIQINAEGLRNIKVEIERLTGGGSGGGGSGGQYDMKQVEELTGLKSYDLKGVDVDAFFRALSCLTTGFDAVVLKDVVNYRKLKDLMKEGKVNAETVCESFNGNVLKGFFEGLKVDGNTVFADGTDDDRTVYVSKEYLKKLGWDIENHNDYIQIVFGKAGGISGYRGERMLYLKLKKLPEDIRKKLGAG